MQTVPNIQNQNYNIVYSNSTTWSNSWSRSETNNIRTTTKSYNESQRNNESHIIRGNVQRSTSRSNLSWEKDFKTVDSWGGQTVTEQSNTVFEQWEYTTSNNAFSTSYRSSDSAGSTGTSSSYILNTDFYEVPYSGVAYTNEGGTAFLKETATYSYEATVSSIVSHSTEFSDGETALIGGTLRSTTSRIDNTTMFNTISSLSIPTITTSMISAQDDEIVGTRFNGAPGVLLMHVDFTKPANSYGSNFHSNIKVSPEIDILESTCRDITLVTSQATNLIVETSILSQTSSYFVQDGITGIDPEGGFLLDSKSSMNRLFNGSHSETYAKTSTVVKKLYNSESSISQDINTKEIHNTSSQEVWPLYEGYKLKTATLSDGINGYGPASESSTTVLSTAFDQGTVNLKIDSSQTISNINFPFIVGPEQTTKTVDINKKFVATHYAQVSTNTDIDGNETMAAGWTSSVGPQKYTDRSITSETTPIGVGWPYDYVFAGLNYNDFNYTLIKNEYAHVSYLQNQTIGTAGPSYYDVGPSTFKSPLVGANYQIGHLLHHGVTPIPDESFYIGKFISSSLKTNNNTETFSDQKTSKERITLSYTDSNLESIAKSSTLVKINRITSEEANQTWGSSEVNGATSFTKTREKKYSSEMSVRTGEKTNQYETFQGSTFELSLSQGDLLKTHDFGDVIVSTHNGLLQTGIQTELTQIYRQTHRYVDDAFNFESAKSTYLANNLLNSRTFTAGGILENGDDKSITIINKINPLASELIYSYYDRRENHSSLASGTMQLNNGSITLQGSLVSTFYPIIPPITLSSSEGMSYTLDQTMAPKGLADSWGRDDPALDTVAGGLSLTTFTKGGYVKSQRVNNLHIKHFDEISSVVMGEIKPNTEILGLGEVSYLPSGNFSLPVGAFSISDRSNNKKIFRTSYHNNQPDWNYDQWSYSLYNDIIYEKTAEGEDNITGSNWASTGRIFGFDSKFGNEMY